MPEVVALVFLVAALFEIHNEDELARVVGEAPRTGALSVPELVPVEAGYAAKYQGRETLRYDARHAWLVVDVDKIVSWDFRKIEGGAPRAGQN